MYVYWVYTAMSSMQRFVKFTSKKATAKNKIKEILVEFVIGCQQCDPYSTSVYCSFALNKTQSTDILYDYW